MLRNRDKTPSPFANKADLVRELLDDGWSLPSDDEISQVYLPDSGPGTTGLPKRSKSGTGSSTARLRKEKGKSGGHAREDEDGMVTWMAKCWMRVLGPVY